MWVGNASGIRDVAFESTKKNFFSGTHRVCSPEETISLLRPALPEFGITRLGLNTGLDGIGIPVAIAIRPNARSISVSQGKGLTDAQAVASALMEAVEFCHAEAITREIRVATRASLLPDASVVAPLARGFPAPADDEVMHWIEGWDLLQQEVCWLPAASVHADYTLPRHPADAPFLCSSNGLGSGNVLLEAVCAAICEVIERDALAIWYARPLQWRAKTRIDTETIEDIEPKKLLDLYCRAGLAVSIWEITSDIGVPSFFTVLNDDRPNINPALSAVGGSGCHPSATVALIRSLTEAAQSRVTRIAGARDDMKEIEKRTLDQKASWYLLDALSNGIERPLPASAGNYSKDLGKDLRWLLARLRHVGVQRVVAVDLSNSVTRVPVVRIVVPELEQPRNHPGYQAGRRALSVVARQ